MRPSTLINCIGCNELNIRLLAVPVLIFLIIGDLSEEILARRNHKRHPGKNMYIRRPGSHHKHHRRSKGKLKPHSKYYSNTWAVHFHPPHRDVAERITKKHGFEILGQVSWSMFLVFGRYKISVTTRYN